jgi:hypothetical protein
MGKTKAEFLDAFKWVIQHMNIAACADAILIRQQFAQENTYQKQVDRIEKLIDRHIAF